MVLEVEVIDDQRHYDPKRFNLRPGNREDLVAIGSYLYGVFLLYAPLAVHVTEPYLFQGGSHEKR